MFRNCMFRLFSTKMDKVGFVSFTKEIWPTLSASKKKQIALNESDPKDPEILYYKGLALAEMGKEFFGEALHAFKKAEELDNEFFNRAHKQIATIYYRQGDVSLAYKELEKICDRLMVEPTNHDEKDNCDQSVLSQRY